MEGNSASEAAWEGKLCGVTESMNLQCSPQAGPILLGPDLGGLGLCLEWLVRQLFAPCPSFR